MGFLIKNRPKPEVVTQMQRRAAGLPTHTLPDWAGQCLNTAAQSLRDFEQTAAPEALLEGIQAAEALHVVLTELHQRRASSSALYSQ